MTVQTIFIPFEFNCSKVISFLFKIFVKKSLSCLFCFDVQWHRVWPLEEMSEDFLFIWFSRMIRHQTERNSVRKYWEKKTFFSNLPCKICNRQEQRKSELMKMLFADVSEYKRFQIWMVNKIVLLCDNSLKLFWSCFWISSSFLFTLDFCI